MTPRASRMTPDDRRQAIVEAVIPLLVAKGGEVTTREVAREAGIAEGTIFRVFPDKRSLLMAAAQEAINPAHGQEEFDAAMAEVTGGLRDRVIAATERVLDRMRLTMSVMIAIRPQLMAEFHEKEHQHQPRPPEFVTQAQEALHRRLTGLFTPYADELAVDPGTAAVALRSLIFGASRPELGMAPALTPDQIADLVLDGVRSKERD